MPRAFDPYRIARRHVDRGDAVVCIPVVTQGERSWAVMYWAPNAIVPIVDPNALALTLIEAARNSLRAQQIRML